MYKYPIKLLGQEDVLSNAGYALLTGRTCDEPLVDIEFTTHSASS